MIVYKCRGFAVKRYEYGGSEIVDMIGSLDYSCKGSVAGYLGCS